MNLRKLRRMTARIPRNIERKEGTQTAEQKIEAEIKAIKGQILEAIKAKADLETVQTMQKQLDALDVKLAEKHAASNIEESFVDTLKKNEEVSAFLRRKAGTVVIEVSAKHTHHLLARKTLITSPDVGLTTPGVLQNDRTPGIVAEARQQLTIRNVLTARPTTMQRIDFVKVNSPMTQASPQQGEGHTKKENAVTFTTDKADVQTIATWIPASRQVLDDFTELANFLETGLAYYVDLAEELQLLSGSGAGVDLKGLTTQATPFNTGLLSGSWTRIDVIGRVIQQITSAKEIQPTFIVLNPVDWWSIRLTKDSQGRYILGDPMGPVTQQQLFGLTPVVTTSIPSGTFLVGSGSPAAAQIRDRMGMQIEISTQHEDYFARNLVAVRAEKRLALVTYRPASFITGTFSVSPA